MKRYIFLTLLAALTIVSCSKNDVIENTSDYNAINFGTYVGKAPVSKAQDITDIKTTGSFYVVGYKTGNGATGDDWASQSASLKDDAPNFMSYTKVSWNTTASSNIWSYDPVRYWPTNGERIHFLAWAPALSANWAWPSTTSQEGTTTYSPITSIAIGAAPENHIDFIWAKAVDQTKENHGKVEENATTGNNQGVYFNFQHMMSKIDFKVKTSVNDDNTVITLTEFSLGNTTNGFVNKADIDLFTGAVTANTDASTTKQGFTFTSAAFNTAEGGFAATTGENANNSKVTTTAQEVLASNKALIVCPSSQALTLPLVVKYTTKTGDNDVITHVVTDNDFSFIPSASTHTTITLNIGLSPISFSSDIDIKAWTPATKDN